MSTPKLLVALVTLIIVLGAGKGYDVELLASQGHLVTAVDISKDLHRNDSGYKIQTSIWIKDGRNALDRFLYSLKST